jgi:MipA family protein
VGVSVSMPRTLVKAFAVAGTVAAAGFFASAAQAEGFFGAEWQAGGFVFVAPKYEGAKDYEVLGAPFIAPAGLDGTGRVQFRGPDDLRFRAIEFNGFEAGPLIGWRFDRDDNDAARLRGLGDVDGGFVAGAYAAYRLGPISPFVSYHHQLSGDDTGALIRFGAETRVPVSGGISVLATVGASYADDDYMESFFSVTAAQSAASVAGLGAYDAEAGIKDVYLGLTSDIPLTDVWTLKLSGRYSRLVGDAADSPIVESEDQFFGGLGLTYRFGAGR